MKNTFVQINEKWPEYREFFVRVAFLTSDDTRGIVCMKLLNDTPGCVESKEEETGAVKRLKNLCRA